MFVVTKVSSAFGTIMGVKSHGFNERDTALRAAQQMGNPYDPEGDDIITALSRSPAIRCEGGEIILSELSSWERH